MALNTCKRNNLTSLHFKGLNVPAINTIISTDALDPVQHAFLYPLTIIIIIIIIHTFLSRHKVVTSEAVRPVIHTTHIIAAGHMSQITR